MINLQTYQSLYEEITEFSLNSNLSVREDFEGVSTGTIEQNTLMFNIKIDNALQSYLLYFGKKIKIKNIEGISFTLDKIINSNLFAQQMHVKDFILNNDSIIRHKYPDLHDINPSFIEYDEIGSVFVFSIAEVENSVLFYYWIGDDNIVTSNHSFTTNLRNLLFYGFMRSLKDESLSHSNIEWLDYFKSLHHQVNTNKLITMRNEYGSIMSEIEYRESTLISLHDYENQFIKFINNKT